MAENLGSQQQYPFSKEGLMPQEEKLEIAKKQKQLTIGVPREISLYENRVALAPHAVELLVMAGHKVMIQKGAGTEAHFSDLSYSEVGGIIIDTSEEIFKADIILKVAPMTHDEIAMLRGEQVVISSLQIAIQDKEYFHKIIEKKITAIAFEYLKDRKNDVYPVMQLMSEISGSTSVLIAAEYLSNANQGKGEMLGGITGISPTDVVILGAGTAGEFAARTAIGLGAMVKVYDTSIFRLNNLQKNLGNRVYTSILQPRVIQKALRSADVVIGALVIGESPTRFLVSEESVKGMKPDSVIVDISIDQGGCFETSFVTDLGNPVYRKHNIIHYCVPNIPSRVARTASYALSNLFGQILFEVGESGGLTRLIKDDPGLRNGVYAINGILTNENIGNRFGFPSRDINLILMAL